MSDTPEKTKLSIEEWGRRTVTLEADSAKQEKRKQLLSSLSKIANADIDELLDKNNPPVPNIHEILKAIHTHRDNQQLDGYKEIVTSMNKLSNEQNEAVFDEEMLKIIRPVLGYSPDFADKLVDLLSEVDIADQTAPSESQQVEKVETIETSTFDITAELMKIPTIRDGGEKAAHVLGLFEKINESSPDWSKVPLDLILTNIFNIERLVKEGAREALKNYLFQIDKGLLARALYDDKLSELDPKKLLKICGTEYLGDLYPGKGNEDVDIDVLMKRIDIVNVLVEVRRRKTGMSRMEALMRIFEQRYTINPEMYNKPPLVDYLTTISTRDMKDGYKYLSEKVGGEGAVADDDQMFSSDKVSKDDLKKLGIWENKELANKVLAALAEVVKSSDAKIQDSNIAGKVGDLLKKVATEYRLIVSGDITKYPSEADSVSIHYQIALALARLNNPSTNPTLLPYRFYLKNKPPVGYDLGAAIAATRHVLEAMGVSKDEINALTSLSNFTAPELPTDERFTSMIKAATDGTLDNEMAYVKTAAPTELSDVESNGDDKDRLALINQVLEEVQSISNSMGAYENRNFGVDNMTFKKMSITSLEDSSMGGLASWSKGERFRAFEELKAEVSKFLNNRRLFLASVPGIGQDANEWTIFDIYELLSDEARKKREGIREAKTARAENLKQTKLEVTIGKEYGITVELPLDSELVRNLIGLQQQDIDKIEPQNFQEVGTKLMEDMKQNIFPHINLLIMKHKEFQKAFTDNLPYAGNIEESLIWLALGVMDIPIADRFATTDDKRSKMNNMWQLGKSARNFVSDRRNQQPAASV